MAVITVSGEPGCRTREVARLVAQRLGFEHISAERLDSLLREEFGSETTLPEKAWGPASASILLRLATEAHLVVGVDGAEVIFPALPHLLRAQVIAHENRRIGNIMLDDHLDRPAAKLQLRDRVRQQHAMRKARFGRSTPNAKQFDVILNAGSFDSAHMAALLETAVASRGLTELGFLSVAAEAQLQFRLRMQLAREGIHPQSKARWKRVHFGHPSEEIFANLLDFYRIAWEYEPRSFPIQWDKDGKVLEAFTPDFYLPESDMYVELTTMKQSLVTRKNRKVKLLRTIYPDINIQVFYQKDLQDLVFKYGLIEQPVNS